MGEDDDIDRSIAQHGWHAIAVDDCDPPFLYTIGLISKSQHPELLILGLDRRTSYSIVTALVELIREGAVIDGRFEILDGLAVVTRPVHATQHASYLGYAMAHARRHDVPLRAIQVFWPDKDGRFPFDVECDAEVAAVQPRLSLPALPAVP